MVNHRNPFRLVRGIVERWNLSPAVRVPGEFKGLRLQCGLLLDSLRLAQAHFQLSDAHKAQFANNTAHPIIKGFMEREMWLDDAWFRLARSRTSGNLEVLARQELVGHHRWHHRLENRRLRKSRARLPLDAIDRSGFGPGIRRVSREHIKGLAGSPTRPEVAISG